MGINPPMKIFDHQSDGGKFFRPIFTINQTKKEELQDTLPEEQVEQKEDNGIPLENNKGK